MKGNFKIENPAEIEMVMTITMTLSEWMALRNQMNNLWPASELKLKILQMVGCAEKNFFEEEEVS